MIDKLTFESVGLNGYTKNAPSNAEEFDAIAGPGKCYDFAMFYIKFHRVLGSFRGDMMEKVWEATDVSPNMKDHPKGKKDAEGKVLQVVDEKPAEYIDRICAEKGVDITSYQSLADAVSETYDFKDFVTEVARSEGPAAGKRDKELAATMLARLTSLPWRLSCTAQRQRNKG
jgi:hypothetical protein